MSFNLPGTFIASGTVSSPSGSQVLVDSGSIAPDFATRGYAQVSIMLDASVAMSFEIGLFASDDSVISTFTYGVSGGVGANVLINHLPIVSGQKFKIRAASASIGTANVAMNIAVIDGD